MQFIPSIVRAKTHDESDEWIGALLVVNDRARPDKRQRIFAFWGLMGMIGLSVSYFFLPLSFPFLAKHRNAVRQLRAWTMGAHFVTDEGVVLQSGNNDCGPASLKMILAAHGIECSISDLSSQLRLTRKGTSMLDLRSVSLKMGLCAKSWSIQPGDLNRIPLPAIAFVNKNHFVVLRKFVAPGVLEVDDPALGKIRWPVREFNRVWSGEMLIFDPAWASP